MIDAAVGREMTIAARHLLQNPLTCAELHPEAFMLVRLHEHELDRWFTQRLGYRLHTTSSTARLHKSTVVPFRRPLRTTTSTKRPFTQREYTQLALVLAAVAAGPRIISLHDLVDDIRSAAVEAGVTLHENGADRRALITAIRWMIANGLASELHDRVDRYIDQVDADAIIEFDPDRIALVPLAALVDADSAADVVDRSERRAANPRRWMRARLVEDPVLYRSDLTEAEWSELRSRRSDEEGFLDEMFDLVLETRADGFAAIDESGTLADRRFPVTRTVGHAALLLIDRLSASGHAVPIPDVVELVAGFGRVHRSRWAKDSVENPERLTDEALDLLVDHRLVVVRSRVAPESAGDDAGRVELVVEALPAAARFSVDEHVVDPEPPRAKRESGVEDGQGRLL